MRALSAAVGAPALFAALYLVPVLLPGELYALHILTLALCYAVPAIGLNLLFGYTGLVSLGHMGFAGVGAYAGALLMKSGVGFVPALAAAAIAAGAVGLLVGAALPAAAQPLLHHRDAWRSASFSTPCSTISTR